MYLRIKWNRIPAIFSPKKYEKCNEINKEKFNYGVDATIPHLLAR